MSNFTSELADCQKEYDTLAVNLKTNVLLSGKRLEPALSEHTPMQLSWGLLGARLSGMHEQAKNVSSTLYGDAFTFAQSNNYKSVNSTEAKWAAEADDDYNKAKTIELKIYRLRKEVEAVIDVIESRKYILKDLTASIINAVDSKLLT